MDDLTFTTQSSFLHHGIQGQKWGIQNGPPYPLDRKARRAERKEARHQKKMEKLNKKSAELAAKTAIERQKTTYKSAQNELAKQKATYRDLKRDKWTKDVYTGESAINKKNRLDRERNSNREYAYKNQQLKMQKQNNGNSISAVLKRTILNSGSTLLSNAIQSVGQDYMNSFINSYKQSHMTPQQQEALQKQAYLKELQYQADVQKAKNIINNPAKK